MNVKPSSRFKRSYVKLPADIQRLAVEKETIFVSNPFNLQLRTHKLRGKMRGFWSFSVSYSYRVVFKFINKDTALFYDIGDHQIYQ